MSTPLPYYRPAGPRPDSSTVTSPTLTSTRHVSFNTPEVTSVPETPSTSAPTSVFQTQPPPTPHLDDLTRVMAAAAVLGARLSPISEAPRANYSFAMPRPPSDFFPSGSDESPRSARRSRSSERDDRPAPPIRSSSTPRGRSTSFADASVQSAASTRPSVQLLFSDASYAPPAFKGTATEDAERWLRRFKYYVQFRQLAPEEIMQLFQLLLTDAAADWLESVAANEKDTLPHLYKAFEERFSNSDIFRWKHASAIFERYQGNDELVDTYITDIQNLAKKVPMNDPTLIRFALLKGFKPSIRQHVLQTSANTLESTIKAARVAEAAASQAPTPNADVAALSKDVRDLISAFHDLKADKVEKTATTNERVASLQTGDRTPSRSPSPSARRVNFADQQRPTPPRPSLRRQFDNPPSDWSWPDQAAPTESWQSNRASYPDFRRSSSSAPRRWQPNRPAYNSHSPYQQQLNGSSGYVPNFGPPSFGSGQSNSFYQSPCRNCLRVHPPNSCPGKGKQCYNCGRMNHLKVACRSPRANRGGYQSNFTPPQ